MTTVPCGQLTSPSLSRGTLFASILPPASFSAVQKLLDLCTEVLKKNIDALEYLGPLPSHILEQIVDRCDVQQLRRLEKFNSVSVRCEGYVSVRCEGDV